MVSGDIDDIESLKTAFSGATAIFGVTDFWQHMRIPANHARAKQTGRSINEICYDREVQQGKNIVDAAATVEGLERFILSTMSNSKKWSKGEVQFNLHFDAKAVAVEYLKEAYPSLNEKSSMVQAGSFMENYHRMVQKVSGVLLARSVSS